MDPVHIYWLAMATVALPCAIGSIAARLVLAVFAGALVALWTGLPLQHAYLALHLFAFAAIRGCRTDWGKLAVALFLPLGIVDYYAVTGRITDAEWWWSVYVLAMLQAGILPMTVRPEAFRDAWARVTAKGRSDVLRFAL